jgi:hypothetical protein
MNAKETRNSSASDHGALHLAPDSVEGIWEQARDTRLAAFLHARLADVEATGCTAERKLAAGVQDLFTEWTHRRELALASDDDLSVMRISTLGWALRCIAHSAWHGTPGWDQAFHPQAPAPATTLEITHDNFASAGTRLRTG